MKDLVLLVADKNAQFALKGALGRPEALGIRRIEFELLVHSGRDGGARETGPEMLALLRRQFKHAFLVLDFEGCGTSAQNAVALEKELDDRLSIHWKNAAKSIVIEPELDVWIWGADNAIETVLEWPPGKHLREWLREQGFEFLPNEKPARPKEAIERALRVSKQPRSSALYRRIAEKISLRRCRDEAFLRLLKQLTTWFPPANP